ncbi:MAG: AzlC family ABC transporter permease [Rhodobacteraceae bacterium]|nr:AzlC family ABC transporter permease [Paracoccaceae bacterium]
MSSSTAKEAFWQGFRSGLPFLIVLIPFAMLFGIAATEAGLPLAQTMAMTVLVIAGAAQFAALALMEENAPILIVLLSALAVNLRMAMYSAGLVVHFGALPVWQRAILAYLIVDQAYAASAQRFEQEPGLRIGVKLAFYMGTITPVFLPWYLATWLGAVVGQRIPPEFALDFALPITFIALIAPMLRTPAHVAAAGVSVVLALGLAWLPWNTGLLVAALAAMMAGARVELWQGRARP